MWLPHELIQNIFAVISYAICDKNNKKYNLDEKRKFYNTAEHEMYLVIQNELLLTKTGLHSKNIINIC